MGVALTKVDPQKVLREMQAAALPAAKEFAIAAGGYVMSEYTVRMVMPRLNPFLQGVFQGVLGLAGVVVGRQARAPWLETFGFGFGMAGAVRAARQVISALIPQGGE